MAEGFVLRFEWDPEKARTNQAKHEVAFERAATVFRDPLQRSLFDAAHSTDEERWVTLGLADDGALLVVVHTYAASDEGATVRIISARTATKRERAAYEHGQEGR